jgi:hypothetical protein
MANPLAWCHDGLVGLLGSMSASDVLRALLRTAATGRAKPVATFVDLRAPEAGMP